MDTKEKAINKVTKLLNEQKFCVLATMSEKYPYSTLVGFYTNRDNSEMIFGTLKNTCKYNNLINYPLVSFIVSDRKNNSLDIKNASALTALGKADIIDNGIENYKIKFLAKHPYMKEFIRDPQCALFKVKVERYILVTEFQKAINIVL